MELARIAELLEPYLGTPEARSPAPGAFQSISTYIDLLQRWNARINLTAIRDEEEIVTRHFGESLFAARQLFPRAVMTDTAAKRRKNAAHGASRGLTAQEEKAAEQRKKLTAADIGSGAGFPGIPIKLWAPEISLTLIESNHKKATFLREVVRTLTLTDINIQNARAEDLAGPTFDVVTLRAVERFEAILPTAVGLVAPNGRLTLLVGADQLATVSNVFPALTWSDPLPIPLSRSRVLLVGRNQDK